MSQEIQLERVSRQQSLPLSIEQYRLWFLQQLEPDSVQFNINWAFYVQGVLDVALFAKSLNRLIRRHESLRTVFRLNGSEPEQVILEELEVGIRTTDLSHYPEDQREQQAVARMHQSIDEPLSLESGPLLRMSFYRLNPEYGIMLITIHHIICDFISLEKIIQELTHYYHSFVTNNAEAAELSPLPVQFADYAYWQKQRLEGELYGKQLTYWKDKLGGELPVLRMPLDHPRPPIMTHNGGRTKFAMSSDLTDKLKAFSRKNGVTLFMALLAAYQTVLHRYSLQEDICIGTSVSSRNRPELHNLIGMFVNTLVLRTKLDGSPTFAEVLKRTRKTTFGAFAHQDIPYEKLIEEIKVERDASHNPFFQTMFTFLSAADDAQEGASLPGLTLIPFEFKKKASALELSLTITEQRGVLLGTMDYNSDLYEKDTIDRLLGHFQQLVYAVVDNPHLPIQEIPLLSDDEKEQLLEVFSGKNNVRAIPDQSVHRLFAEQAARTPDAIAVRHKELEYSYRELDERSDRLANYLIGAGKNANKLIGVCMERSIEWIVSLLGVMKAGSAYVPVDPHYPSERIAYMLQDSGVETVIVSGDTEPLIKECSAAATVLVEAADIDEVAGEARLALPSVGTNDLMYVIYTSGSTGKPKGVMVPHRAVVNHCLGVIDRFELQPTDRVLQFTSVSFDVAVQEIFPTLIRGATLVLWKDKFISGSSEFLQWMEQEEVTIANLTTAHWSNLVNDLKQRLAFLPDRLRLVIVGGETVSRETYASWKSVVNDRVKWINDYGLTETTITATMFDPACDWQAARTVPIGTPLDNVEVYVLDGSLGPSPIGVYGELCVGGAGVAGGYLNRPELTAERFVPHPFKRTEGARLFRTGDLARFLPDGNIEFVGRLDNQIKIRGYRIELGEIEAALEQCDRLTKSVVAPTRLANGSHMLAAYVVPVEPSVQVRDIKHYLKDKLPEYMIPGQFIVVDHIPLTENGKVNVSLLPKPDLAASSTKPYVAPRTANEHAAAELWAEVVGLANISVKDNYFELGGNSLLATRLVAEANQRFGCSIPLKLLFEYPVLEDWAAQIESLADRSGDREAGQRQSGNCMVRINQQGSRTPIYFIHPVGGSVSCYFSLSEQLGGNQPFFALQAEGMADQHSSAMMTVEQMADRYAAEITEARKTGPYRLGGWSLGGFIAYEIAKRLLAAGHEVSQLVLIDSYLNQLTEIDDEVIFYNFVRQLAVGAGLEADDASRLDWERFRGQPDAAVCEQLKTAGIIPAAMEDGELRRMFRVYADTARAFYEYRPSPYPKLAIEQVQLFRAEDSPEREGVWGSLLDRLSMHDVKADHFSIVHHEEVGRAIQHDQVSAGNVK